MHTSVAAPLLSWLAASAAVMLGLPWLAVAFAPADAGMAVCLVLFFAVNPLYAVAAGICAGHRLRRLWPTVVFPAALFLAGSWPLFDPNEMAFAAYAGCYLGLSLIAAIGSFLLSRKAKPNTRAGA